MIFRVLALAGEVLSVDLYHDPDHTEWLLPIVFQEEEFVTVLFEETGPFWEYDFWGEIQGRSQTQSFSMEVPFPLLITRVVVADYPAPLNPVYDSLATASPIILYLNDVMAARVETRLAAQLDPDPPTTVENNTITVDWRSAYQPEAFDGWASHWSFNALYTRHYPIIYGLYPRNWLYVVPVSLQSEYIYKYPFLIKSLEFWFYCISTGDWIYSSDSLAPYAWSANKQEWVVMWNPLSLEHPYGLW